MKASPRQQQLLLDLQAFDTQLVRLARRRAQLPERAELETLGSETASARDTFMAAQRALEDLNTEIARVESDVETVRARHTRTTERLAGSVAAKEAQSLQEELDSLNKRTIVLEDRELELMEEAETAQQAFDAAAATVADIDQRRTDLERRIAEAEAEIDTEHEQTSLDRENLAAEVQRDILDVYHRTRDRYGIGAARLNGRVSEGSNMELGDADYAAVLEAPADELFFCPVSGAILVRLPEDGGTAA